MADASTANNKLGYRYSWILREDDTNSDICNLKLVGPKNIADVQVGDVITKHNGEEYPVLMRSGDIVVFGVTTSYGYQASGNYTIKELEHKGLKVKQPAPLKPAPVKLTVAQIAEKLGHEVEVIAE